MQGYLKQSQVELILLQKYEFEVLELLEYLDLFVFGLRLDSYPYFAITETPCPSCCLFCIISWAQFTSLSSCFSVGTMFETWQGVAVVECMCVC